MRQDGIEKNTSSLEIIAFERTRLEIRTTEESNGIRARYNRT